MPANRLSSHRIDDPLLESAQAYPMQTLFQHGA